jgi:hypothetical protein
VDSQVSNLLQVELERGLAHVKNEENAVGLAKRRNELARQQDGVQQEIQSLLLEKQTEQEKNLKGKTTMNHILSL